MGIDKQFLALQKGFHELLPPHLLKLFDERELELIVSGLGSVDVDDWMNNTKLKHCTLDSDIVQWFWKVSVHTVGGRGGLLIFFEGLRESKLDVEGLGVV